MAWTTPATWSTGQVVEASDLNAQIKGNMELTAPALFSAQGDILYATGANAPARLAKDANATRSLTNTGTNNNPAWAQVALATGVSGTLPVANGGTGATSLTDHYVLVGSGTGAVTPITPDSSGYVLTSNGTGSDPTFQAAGGSSNSADTMVEIMMYS
jgi:hypothetical protein